MLTPRTPRGGRTSSIDGSTSARKRLEQTCIALGIVFVSSFFPPSSLKDLQGNNKTHKEGHYKKDWAPQSCPPPPPAGESRPPTSPP